MYEREILDLFKVMVAEKSDSYHFNDGVVTDFVPTAAQAKILREKFGALDIKTLFSVEERRNADLDQLILKQILHYIEVYGLDMPGLFNLEVTEGQVVTLTYVKGVSMTELGTKVRELLYANAPIKDTEALKNIVYHYHIEYDINFVANNEMRTILFNKNSDVFESGDDAVRYLCYLATDNSMLIKSQTVIDALKQKANEIPPSYLERHATQLSKVFLRHKPLLLALKASSKNRSVINHIRRLATKNHTPIIPALNKNFVTNALKGASTDRIDEISVRDKFKYLNLLEYKSMGLDVDAFVIRNGKVHVEEGREIQNPELIRNTMNVVCESLARDLGHLSKQKIVLDRHVDYGLPISRKQTLGNLPFGTAVTPDGNQISSGIYWHNDGGARDLDLSAISLDGHRVGWGQRSGYADKGIIFSGDVTSAPSGAMEFLTSDVGYKSPYGLFVNIFSGNVPSTMEVVVGNESKDRWINNTCLREKHELNSKGNLLGFVKDGKFIAYSVRLTNNMVSSPKDKAIVNRGLANFWTIRRLFDMIGIPYEFEGDGYDLTYASFTYDKLEQLLLA